MSANSNDMCGTCDEPIDDSSQDVVKLNGSCKHVHHAFCWLQRVTISPGGGCSQCPGAHATLWDAPLEITRGTLFGSKTEVVSNSIVPEETGLLGRIWKNLDDLLSVGVDGTHAARLKANLPIQQLIDNGCTPEKLLAEMKGGLVQYLVRHTKYSAKQLVELGLVWKHYLEGGLTEQNFPDVLNHYGTDFLIVVVLNTKNLMNLCSNDATRLAGLQIRAQDWKLLIPRNSVPVRALAQCGITVYHFAMFKFTMEEWRDEMGLTPEILRSLRPTREAIEEFWCGSDPGEIDHFYMIFSTPKKTDTLPPRFHKS